MSEIKRYSVDQETAEAFAYSEIVEAGDFNVLGSAMLIGKSLEQSALQITMTAAALITGMFLIFQLMRKVNAMEAE